MNGASSWSPRPRPPRSATTRIARNAGTGASLPLRTCSPAGSNAIAWFAARSVDSPTSTVPGWATDWRRDAVFTMSPATMPWFVAPIVTAASPVRYAGARIDSGAERPDRSDEIERGADRALGVVLTRDRCTPDGHDGVADELLDRPAVAADHLAGKLEVARQELAGLLGVAALGQRREADEIGEQDRDEAAFRDRGGRAGGDLPGRWPKTPLASPTPVGVPHSAQNLAPARSGEPHCRQPACSALPHSEQKRALGGAAAPQFEHVISGGALSMIPGRPLA